MADKAVFRVDASQKFGTGHVARTRHFADQFQANGYNVVWVATPETFDLIPSLLDQYNCFAVDEDQSQTGQVNQYMNSLNDGKAPDFVIQDGFHMNGETVSAFKMRNPNTKIVLIEDKANRFMGAPDYLVDPSFNPLSVYTSDLVSRDTQILLGPQYQMLDPSFQDVKSARQDIADKDEIVLMNGGGNLGNLLGLMVNSFANRESDLKDHRFTVYTLSKSRDSALLKTQVDTAQKRGLNIDLRLDQKPDFTSTAMYVGAAGTACYELGAVGGVPSVLIGAGHNQDAIGQQLENRGAALYAGTFLNLEMCGTFNFCSMDFESQITDPVIKLLSNKEILMEMTHQSANFCDGLGAARVYGEIAKNAKSPVHA